jgi:hypothetical protein
LGKGYAELHRPELGASLQRRLYATIPYLSREKLVALKSAVALVVLDWLISAMEVNGCAASPRITGGIMLNQDALEGRHG